MPDNRSHHGDPMNDDLWVVLSYHDHEPVEVYGTFTSEQAALTWAQSQAVHTTWAVHSILNVKD
jgi:hypothetical protein